MKRNNNPKGTHTLVRRLPVSLAILACAFSAGILIPALRHQTTLFAVVGTLLMVTALAMAVHQRSGTGQRMGTVVFSLATGLMAFLAATALTLA